MPYQGYELFLEAEILGARSFADYLRLPKEGEAFVSWNENEIHFLNKIGKRSVYVNQLSGQFFSSPRSVRQSHEFLQGGHEPEKKIHVESKITAKKSLDQRDITFKMSERDESEQVHSLNIKRGTGGTLLEWCMRKSSKEPFSLLLQLSARLPDIFGASWLAGATNGELVLMNATEKTISKSDWESRETRHGIMPQER